MREKFLNNAVEDLQEKHRALQEKLSRQQEEKRRMFKDRIEDMHEKAKKIEEKVQSTMQAR